MTTAAAVSGLLCLFEAAKIVQASVPSVFFLLSIALSRTNCRSGPRKLRNPRSLNKQRRQRSVFPLCSVLGLHVELCRRITPIFHLHEYIVSLSRYNIISIKCFVRFETLFFFYQTPNGTLLLSNNLSGI